MDFDFHYTPEMEGFRKEVRAWLDQNVKPEFQAPADPLKLSYEQFKINREFSARLGERGWYAPTWPKEYGGGGLKPEFAVVLEEELSAKIDNHDNLFVSAGIGFMAAAGILRLGTEEQKARFLPPILQGKQIVWELFTEPGAGSDLLSMTTSAVREGDQYVINGQKTFVGAIHDSDYMITLTNSNPQGPRGQNISAFMIPTNTPGVTVQSLDLIGGGGKRTIFFEDAKVPVVNRIGEENDGFKVFTGRREVPISLIVDRDRYVDRIMEHCREHSYNGEPVSKDPDIQDLLVRTYIEYQTHRTLSKRNFWMGFTGQRFWYEGQQLGMNRKLLGPKIAQAMLTAIGPASLTDDERWGALKGEAELFTRDAIVMGHPGGTVEIHKLRLIRGLRGTTVFER